MKPARALAVLALAALAAACGEAPPAGFAPNRLFATGPIASAIPVDVFVNPAPDAGGDAAKASADVGWSPGSTTAATGYLVRYSVNGGAETTLQAPVTPGVTLTGLPAGATLTLKVAAQTAGGLSADSTTITAVLPSPSTAAQAAAYASAAAYSDAQKGEALVVFRNGATVYTHYAAGYANTAHALASGAKSFSCAFEILAEQDKLLTLADKASDVVTEWRGDANKAPITVLQLLSLQAGLSGNPAYSAGAASTLDTYKLAVQDTSSYPPGQVFIYDPLAFQDFALLFQVKTGGVYGGAGAVSGGQDPIGYLQAKLFDPLGIAANAYAWGRDALGRPQMAGGASFTATDWLRYGQLVLQGGAWKTRRVLDAGKLAFCTGGYVNPAYQGYGVSWWLNAHNNGTYQPGVDQVPADGAPADGGDQFAPHAPPDTFMAAGTGKERLYVIPSLKMVVVRFAPLNSGGAGSTWSDDTFLGKVTASLP